MSWSRVIQSKQMFLVEPVNFGHYLSFKFYLGSMDVCIAFFQSSISG